MSALFTFARRLLGDPEKASSKSTVAAQPRDAPRLSRAQPSRRQNPPLGLYGGWTDDRFLGQRLRPAPRLHTRGPSALFAVWSAAVARMSIAGGCDRRYGYEARARKFHTVDSFSCAGIAVARFCAAQYRRWPRGLRARA